MEKTAAISQRIDSLVDLLAQHAKKIEAGAMIEWAPINEQVEALCRDVQALPPGQGVPLKPRLLVLVDEVTRLEDVIARHCADVQSRIKSNARNRIAAAAYRAGRPSSAGD